MDILKYRWVIGMFALVVCAQVFVSDTYSNNSSYTYDPQKTLFSSSDAFLVLESDSYGCVEDVSTTNVDLLQNLNGQFVCRFA